MLRRFWELMAVTIGAALLAVAILAGTVVLALQYAPPAHI